MSPGRALGRLPGPHQVGEDVVGPPEHPNDQVRVLLRPRVPDARPEQAVRVLPPSLR